jgi:hypothetical protein
MPSDEDSADHAVVSFAAFLEYRQRRLRAVTVPAPPPRDANRAPEDTPDRPAAVAVTVRTRDSS